MAISDREFYSYLCSVKCPSTCAVNHSASKKHVLNMLPTGCRRRGFVCRRFSLSDMVLLQEPYPQDKSRGDPLELVGGYLTSYCPR